MTPTFSVIHASYGRPEKAVATMKTWFDRAVEPTSIEYIFAIEDDDPTGLKLVNLAGESGCFAKIGCAKIVNGNFRGSAPAWDAAAKASTGKLLIQASDDVFPPMWWDLSLLNAGPWNAENAAPTVIAVKDGYRNDALLFCAICNRARYHQQGEFLHAGYQSVFSDDEFSLRCYADEADGKCMVIRTDLVFLHQNPYHTGAPQNNTLRRQNSPEAYAMGQKLFVERNKELLKRGFRTWT